MENTESDKIFGVPKEFTKMPIQERLLSGVLRIKPILLDPSKYFDKQEIVGGWARTVRKQNNLIFVELNDGSCFESLQIVVENTIKNFADLEKSNVSTCFKFKGTLVKSPKEGQPIEMLLKDDSIHFAEIVGQNENVATFPLAKKFHPVEHLRKFLHLRPRSNIISSSTRVRNSISFATHLFFQSLNFFYVHTPIITVSDCEGAGELFQVTTLIPEDGDVTKIPKIDKTTQIDYSKDLFQRKAFLTCSGQLSVEASACGLSQVYTFGPTFRAENSHTTRHLSEFWMIEPEMVFAGLEENMKLAEDYIRFCVDYCLKNNRDDLDFFNEKIFKPKHKEDLIEYLTKIVKSNFARLSYSEGIKILEEAQTKGGVQFEKKVEWGIDLGSEHERYLCEKHVKGPVFLYDYPKEIKAFYMRVNQDNKTVQAMDLLVPLIGEVIGGSVREERAEVLLEKIKAAGLDPAEYKFYEDLRRYGTVPHCGFGLGLERLIMLVTGIENIRETIPYPRHPGLIDN